MGILLWKTLAKEKKKLKDECRLWCSYIKKKQTKINCLEGGGNGGHVQQNVFFIYLFCHEGVFAPPLRRFCYGGFL